MGAVGCDGPAPDRRTNASRTSSLPPKPLSLSIVVPVFNSASTLERLVGRLRPVVEGLSDTYELILVNDGSRDRSWEIISELTDANEWIRAIDLMRNYGQHNAVLCGIRAAKHAVIVTLDDDLQNPPEEIAKLLEELDKGYDVVYGVPATGQQGVWRVVSSQLTKLVLQTAMGAETARNISAFRAFRTEVRNAFGNFQAPYVSIDVLLTWGASRFSGVRVAHAPRAAGKSNYTLGMLLTHGLNLVTGFSNLPLRLASVVGFAFTLFGLAILAYVVGRYLVSGTSVPGFPFLASIIAIFSGAQLFSLGLIGEYLARIHSRSIDHPSYVVRQAINGRAGGGTGNHE